MIDLVILFCHNHSRRAYIVELIKYIQYFDDNLFNSNDRELDIDKIFRVFMLNASEIDNILYKKAKIIIKQLLFLGSDAWWRENKLQWIDKFKCIVNECRLLGLDWHFDEQQKKLLRKYYDANLLLVEILNSDCYIKSEVRQEITETLLLPIAEIEKRNKL